MFSITDEGNGTGLDSTPPKQNEGLKGSTGQIYISEEDLDFHCVELFSETPIEFEPRRGVQAD